jgi:hypothetical protein
MHLLLGAVYFSGSKEAGGIGESRLGCWREGFAVATLAKELIGRF